MKSILRSLLAVVVMAGLAIAPMAVPAAAKNATASLHQMSGDMPCCPDEAMRDGCDGCKNCPCMAICVVTTFQAAPVVPSVFMNSPAFTNERTFANDLLADGLGQPPPARPPRA